MGMSVRWNFPDIARSRSNKNPRATYQVTPLGLVCSSHCNEIPITNYTGSSWDTSEDVLSHLLNSPNLRRLLIKMSSLVAFAESDPVLLVHPLLSPPIRLEQNLNDTKLKEKIKERLAKERGRTDKQVVLYSKVARK
jgi:hypothetical protein